MRLAYLSCLYLALWAAALNAPPQPDPLGPYLVAMFTLQGPEGWTAALFNLMGIWPLAYAGVLLLDGPGQRVPAWPFVLLSFGLGMFALMPYLLLRRPGQPARDLERGWRRWLAHPFFGAMVLVPTLAFMTFGAATGNPTELAVLWNEDGFVRTFLCDFAVFFLAYPVVLADDLDRFDAPRGRLGWAALPLLGPALHLLLRRRAA